MANGPQLSATSSPLPTPTLPLCAPRRDRPCRRATARARSTARPEHEDLSLGIDVGARLAHWRRSCPAMPVTTLLRRARSAIVIRKTVITPRGMLTPSAVQSFTRICGIGPSTSSNPPRVSNAMPPSPSMPCVANFASSDEQHKRRDDQRERRITRGQQIQREQCQQNENHAHDAGHHRAGMVELGVERQRAHRQHQERDVRIEQEVEDASAAASSACRRPARRPDPASPACRRSA